jgi:hypothetical protein
MFFANRKVSILRGTTTDPWGDPKDRDEAVHTGIPASVMLVRSAITTVSDGRPQQVGFLVGRVPAGTDILNEDRLKDESSGEIFIVDAVNLQAQSAILDSGIRLDLRRVS